ncbi:MAG: 16S rRNA (uracil(1498)-N(3))-methyltransferase [Clostridia bacterium]|nr:16S rRNA (uracil(1498)-N(3))-methyltransferase [Clostridia bacterium]
MERKRFYFEKNLFDGNNITLSGDEFHHMIDVMRIKPNESVVLFCGDGFDYISTVIEIKKKEAILKVEKIEENKSEIGFNLTVFQALAKGEKLSLIAQKLTELGTTQMLVFSSAYCDVKPSTSRLDKLNKIVISACKQCGRSVLMTTNEKPLSFNEVTNEIKQFDACYFAYENENKETLYENLCGQKNIKNVAVIIGAEGGFSKEEANILTENGAISVSLGNRILRTETAAIYSASVIGAMLEKVQK